MCGARCCLWLDHMKRGVASIKIYMQNLSCKFCLLVFIAFHLRGVINFRKTGQNKKERRKEDEGNRIMYV